MVKIANFTSYIFITKKNQKKINKAYSEVLKIMLKGIIYCGTARTHYPCIRIHAQIQDLILINKAS